ncbi:MAG: hypothetical protein IJT03_01865 [Clostridia bacterium]|nr:hypothetical protein [Clostridia bacterium]
MTKIFISLLLIINTLLTGLGANPLNGKWQLDGIPEYTSGILSKNVYNAGAGLASDEFGPTDEDSRMQIASGTTLEEFGKYCDLLEESGFTNTYYDHSEGIASASFRSGDKLVYTYFCEKNRQARIIEDNGTNSFEDFGYTYSSDEGVTVYQFDYPYQGPGEKRDQKLYSTNGMMYIIRLADNSLIVIDGGSIRQSSDKNIEECMKFMHKITNTAEDETVRIALWYGTHGHSDHITFFYKLIGFYHTRIDLERVMFNYPALELIEHDGRADMYRERLAKLYPDVKYLKAHTGMRFDIANAQVSVLYTHEDAVKPFSGKTPVKNANDGSVVCRITSAGKRFLVLGDINVLAQDRIVKMYDDASLKTDLLQAAHHLYNADTILYAKTDAEWVLCPMSPERAHLGLPGYTSARLFYKEKQLLFADEALYSVKMESSGLTVGIDHSDCGPYDDSSMNEIK